MIRAVCVREERRCCVMSVVVQRRRRRKRGRRRRRSDWLSPFSPPPWFFFWGGGAGKIAGGKKPSQEINDSGRWGKKGELICRPLPPFGRERERETGNCELLEAAWWWLREGGGRRGEIPTRHSTVSPLTSAYLTSRPMCEFSDTNIGRGISKVMMTCLTLYVKVGLRAYSRMW